MFSTNFKGEDLFVLDNAWNGQKDFKLDARLVRDTQASLTRREGRRAYSETFTCKANYQVTLRDAALRKVQASLRALTTERVIIPLWPAICFWESRALESITGGLRLVWKPDWSDYAIYTSGDPEPIWPGARDLFAPALLGYLAPTQPQMLTPDAARWDIEFNESSPADYALSFPTEEIPANAIRDTAGDPLLDLEGQTILGI